MQHLQQAGFDRKASVDKEGEAQIVIELDTAFELCYSISHDDYLAKKLFSYTDPILLPLRCHLHDTAPHQHLPPEQQ
jgi:hypothetical protein